MTIGADVAEQAVVEAVQGLLAGIAGTASAIPESASLAPKWIESKPSSTRRCARSPGSRRHVPESVSRRSVTNAITHVTSLAELEAVVLPAVTISAADWSDLTLEEQRDLVPRGRRGGRHARTGCRPDHGRPRT